MRRFLKLLFLVTLFSAIPSARIASGMTDEEKKQMFLKAREEMQTVEEPKRDTGTPTPKPKPKPASHRNPATPSPVKPKPSPTPRASATPSAPEATPRHKAGDVSPEESPQESKRPTPAPTPPPATPKPTPAPTPSPTPPPVKATPEPSKAPVVVQKPGMQDEVVPPPAPEPRGWWPWSRSPSYKYLTRSVLDAIRNAPVAKGRWRYIVVHNSGTRQGNAKIFDYYHLHTRKMPNGLAYHFVIGNGSSSGDGQIEIGNRWRRQINGGHVHSDFLNSISIGICLVGDYNRDTPTKAQLAALDELIRYLRQRVGKFDGHVAVVKAHREINPVPTDCPGDRFPYRWLHSSFD